MKFRLYYVPEFLAVIKAKNQKDASLVAKYVFHTESIEIRKMQINDLLLDNAVVLDGFNKELKGVTNELSKV